VNNRQEFRTALAAMADKTLTKIPSLNGRVAKACTLVLQGDVALQADTSALVSSLTDPGKAYQLKDGVCQCKDWQHAPSNLCAHRLAVGFTRKLAEVLAAEAPAAPVAAPLPEAASSVNFRTMINGFECQITLRDNDEIALFERLRAVLARPDIRPLPQKAPARQQWRKT
jgi:hypothetical protein